MFGIDYHEDGMQIAMPIHPPAFGMKLDSFDASEALQMKGISHVISVRSFKKNYGRAIFDEHAFPEFIAVVGDSVWNVMQAKKKVKANWKPFDSYALEKNIFGNKSTVTVPAGLESTTEHYKTMKKGNSNALKTLRKDGNPEVAFKNAHKVIESTYTAPFLAHNAMEPVNCFAEASGKHIRVVSPMQAPEYMETTLADNFGISKENIDLKVTRMGGGFGRRAYSFNIVEAVAIAQKVKTPVQLIYTREDDMTGGIYRPMYQIT
ncbi:isoquinoline 1-oxidoreductase, beta subunit [Pustulibacterium marinum]|uniref:Isoquinoline 1-oxidoreductase, beta subunit n=1 Tax=Pustulibacterium marinum TaxID=1224947 RepID=A0A1I7GFD6_9FLAO|nr:molybdopterin cofactor-binding domain-containing protein [Pustulibacterium marinum]SFU47155.1 isoquinoline 1-oxidoreductase, beta subunit [Pustulibacterium marinum]